MWRTVWFFFRRYLEGKAITRVKRQGVIAYIHALQGTRHALLAIVIGFFVFHFIVLAGIGALVTGMFMMNLEIETILTILFCIFSLMFFVPVGFLCFALSERMWYRYSGAEKMVEKLRAEDSAATRDAA